MAAPTISPPEASSQRAIIEPLLSKALVEGDFWYTVVSDWINQWKRYVGIHTLRKYYHERSPPGPLVTLKEFAHSVETIHEDAWKLFIQWYGITEGHKITKTIVYCYGNKPEIEHNLSSFRTSLANSVISEPHIVKFSKMDKVGHVELKLRKLYSLGQQEETRLWGKAMETEPTWKPLFNRDKAIGKVLNVDSDFIRSAIAVEVKDEDGVWRNRPSHAPKLQDNPIGRLYENNVFEDLTTHWELDIHEQIDDLGKTFMDKLHVNFSTFMNRAKDFVDDRRVVLEDREKAIIREEERLSDQMKGLDDRERELQREKDRHERDIKDFQKECGHQNDLIKQEWALIEAGKQKLTDDRAGFDAEMKRMSEVHQIADSRVKLDIGGHIFTTSVLTLTKDPDSMLAAMFSGRHSLRQEKDESHFIDRDGTHFRYLLNYLRDGGVQEGTLPKNEVLWRELLTEAEYFQLGGLVQYLTTLLYKKPKYSK